MTNLKVVSILFLFILFTGCADDSTTFDRAKSKDTFSAYFDYKKKFPKGKHREEADFRINLKNEYTNKGFWEFFIDKYPDGDFVDDAQFEIVKLKEDINEYLNFIDSHPNSNVLPEARSIVEEMLYEKSKTQPNLSIYSKMMRYIPDGKYSEKIAPKLNELLAERDPLVAEAQSLSYSLDLDMPYHQEDRTKPGLYSNSNHIEDDFQREIEYFADMAGLLVVDGDTETADIHLHVQASGSALKGEYIDMSPGKTVEYIGTRYAGARIEGTIYLRKTDELIAFASFAGTAEPIHKLQGDRRKPSQAPFDKAYQKAFPYSLNIFMARYFGENILYNVIREKMKSAGLDDLSNYDFEDPDTLDQILKQIQIK